MIPLLVQLLMLVIVIDGLLRIVQWEADRWPRRVFHLATEWALAPLRRALGPRRELAPLALLGILGFIRVWM